MSFKHTHCDASGLPSLAPLLQAWLAVQRRYTQITGDDYSFNYHERAHVGFLAAAAWRTGGVALEEWRTAKGHRSSPRNGRCDLYVFQPDAYEFHIEAKHIWARATARDPLKSIKAKLADAVKNAKDNQCSKNQKVGLLFVAPYYPPRKQADMSKHLPLWLKSVCDGVRHSAVAWQFRDLRSIGSGDGGNICPGVVLLARTP